MTINNKKRKKQIDNYFDDHISFMGFTKEQEKVIREKIEKDLTLRFNVERKKEHPMDRKNRNGRVKDKLKEKLL